MVHDRQNWRARARCKDLNADESDALFFLTTGKSAKAAREFCNGCEVQSQCIDYAVYYNESGVWGGTTDEERNRIRSLNLLSTGRLTANNVNINETRDQKQWGLGTVQIQQEREKREKQSQKLSRLQQYSETPETEQQELRPQDRLPLMLVVEL